MMRNWSHSDNAPNRRLADLGVPVKNQDLDSAALDLRPIAPVRQLLASNERKNEMDALCSRTKAHWSRQLKKEARRIENRL